MITNWTNPPRLLMANWTHFQKRDPLAVLNSHIPVARVALNRVHMYLKGVGLTGATDHEMVEALQPLSWVTFRHARTELVMLGVVVDSGLPRGGDPVWRVVSRARKDAVEIEDERLT